MNILDKILAHKRDEVSKLDMQSLRCEAERSPRPRNFIALLEENRVGARPGLIAELKRASPSRGLLAPQLDLAQVAEIYAANGSAAISVLTDEKFFQGKLETIYDLRYKKNIRLPLLRKDFIIHPAQIYETRAIGSSGMLLIAVALTDNAFFADLHALALDLGLTPLVEVHDEADIERALRLRDIRLIGINNRNLNTFEVNLGTTERLRALIPAGIHVISESGIFDAADVERLAASGVDGILVGEALVTVGDIAAKVRELSGLALEAQQEVTS